MRFDLYFKEIVIYTSLILVQQVSVVNACSGHNVTFLEMRVVARGEALCNAPVPGLGE